MATLYNKTFPGYQPCQLVKQRENQRLKDHLCSHFQGTDVSGPTNQDIRDIKARMAVGNQSYYALTKIMKAREISKSTKLKIYKTIIRPIVMYGCDGWTVSKHMEEALGVWERKILRKVYSPKRDANGWRIRINKELQDHTKTLLLIKKKSISTLA
jgi:hypothetical protein